MEVIDELKKIDADIEDGKAEINAYYDKLSNLIERKEHIETLFEDYWERGFAISKRTQERIDKWKKEHRKKCSCQYFEYIFSPSEVGTGLYVKCPRCNAGVECNCSSDPICNDDDYDNGGFKWKV